VSRTRTLLSITLVAVFFTAGNAWANIAQDPPSEETIQFFKVNCFSCHTIGGGPLTGPDLQGLHERRDRDWSARFIRDPQAVLDSGDPYASALVSEYRGTVMPSLPGIDATLAGKLYELIEVESAREKSRFEGIKVSDRPLTEADVTAGRELFMGTADFAAGGPACVSCHTLAGIGGLGGGKLGPDLTGAYSRLEGRKALGAWLAAPPSPVMQPLFIGHELNEDEILALVAYLKAAAEQGEREADSASLTFILLGIGVCAGLLVVFDLAWRNRFRAVRRPLVARG
jgi:mono/diheme cytochrome c family protein